MNGRQARVFGLTGGLASGKSTVAERYRRRGVPVIDADQLAREAVARGSPGLAEVVRAFGQDVLRDGALDRKRLATLVFSDPEALARLERITHPRVRALLAEKVQALSARGEPLVGYEVPLLFEKGLESQLSPVIVVSVPRRVQIERAMARSGVERADVEARLAAQLPLREKVARADLVIDNQGPLDQSLALADAALDRVCLEAGIDPARYPLP